MNALASALPRTLAGRVLLILFGGLVVALAASFALFVVERTRALEHFAATDLAARIVEYARTPSSTPNPIGREGGPRLRLRWREVSAVGDPPAGTHAAATGFTSELRRLLIESLGTDPVVWIATREAQRPQEFSKMVPRSQEFSRTTPHPDGPDEGSRPGGTPGGPRLQTPPGRIFPGGLERNAEVVTVALELPGGRKALAETFVFQPSLQIPAEAWVSLLLLFAVTAIFSIWAVRLAVQPVRMLADAAERLSRNIDEPPLPEKGAAEIRAATRAFNRMQDRLRRHVNSRALAFAAMSHDIRTPLTRMRLRLESLSPEARAKIEDDLGEIESIARSVLEVARELSSDEPMVRVDLVGLVRRLLDDYAPLGARIPVSGSCSSLAARPAALRRALANLIDNGLKYGEQVSIELGDSGDYSAIRVCDRGPGIPEEHLANVVSPFYRVESSRNRDTGGSGLGLAIAKDIVEGQGGELLLENLSGGGFCATIRLPR